MVWNNDARSPPMNPEGMPSREVLDPDTLQQLLDLDDGELGLIREMCGLFRDDTPPRIALLEEAVHRNDRVQMGDTAHAVKGAASTMGAPKVRALAQALEAGSRSGDFPEEPAVLLAKLKCAFDEALAGLESFIAAKA
jgi:HPt (histidine-containing phosphotransfer) domain-containing protein